MAAVWDSAHEVLEPLARACARKRERRRERPTGGEKERGFWTGVKKEREDIFCYSRSGNGRRKPFFQNVVQTSNFPRRRQVSAGHGLLLCAIRCVHCGGKSSGDRSAEKERRKNSFAGVFANAVCKDAIRLRFLATMTVPELFRACLAAHAPCPPPKIPCRPRRRLLESNGLTLTSK